MQHPRVARNTAVWLWERRLRQHGWPKLQMFLIVLLTGACGFLTSAGLLHLAELKILWLRYALASLSAYLVFLALLRFWLFYKRTFSGFDLPDVNLDFSGANIDLSGLGESGDFAFSGASGDAGGGGAGGSWDGGDVSSLDTGGSHSSLFDGVSLDGDEGCLLLAAILLLALGILVVALYFIYSAPVLLAELLVDGLLMSGVYREMQKREAGNWLPTALRKTWLPAALLIVSLAVSGFLLQKAVPRANSLGDVWRFRKATKNH